MSAPEQSTTNIQTLKNPPPREISMPDQKIDMFSLRGFELACRIGKAFAASDAVPAIFRSHTSKKDKDGSITWIENPAALGNCVVAVETAQAVGVSITAVMQNANVIEGRLSWSGKFVIAAVNASHRFTPLRFHMVNKGMMTAKYREKQGWNKQKGGFDFVDKQVELENIECTAWAIPYGMQFPPGIGTLPQAIAAGLPVIEGAPVSMAMAVEEGWYSKPGSKWQTSMKTLMLQYRAGSFFGNIHAPDVVMGMGKSSEEVYDTIDFEQQPDGRHAVNLNTLRPELQNSNAGVVVSEASQGNVVDQPPESQAGEPGEPQAGTAAGPASETSSQAAQAQDGDAVVLSYAQVADAMAKATSIETLQVAIDMISGVPNAEQQDELRGISRDHLKKFQTPAAAKPVGKRAAAPSSDSFNME
ncbi:hypothetical protein [Herbaspirillum sp. RV1423]|uniref:hypothetical protein n=1 Tax=Herbaspirillum sp. RV1423 TaxID=1443993 RepID=UPI0004B43680|nr:hypothetical protein [Herbaspirillum sp. RV1423]